MVFSSLTFLFLFFPSVFLSYFSFINKIKIQNLILMSFSLLFYYWGEKDHIFIMLACILVNYLCALFIQDCKNQYTKKVYLITSICLSVGLLVYFKYFNFFLNTSAFFLNIDLKQFKQIALPLGISFYTFHSLSYVLDVYWNKVAAERNFITFVCYVSLFPQLVAGPIVRYTDIRRSFHHRYITVVGLRNGILRFCFGLGKKVLIANEVAHLADNIFALPVNQLDFGLAWLGAISYSLQIYFDFSGYSDMAIGIGLMFGFKYKENFKFPYSSLSIQEFWRKWHISLSTWFRDYVYIPLGGSRFSSFKTYLNLIIVFFLCGFWHGAHYTFIVWGLYHGLFLALERNFLGKFLKNRSKLLQHFYVLITITVGWVFFREESLHKALLFIKAMFIPKSINYSLIEASSPLILFLPFTIGIILSFGFNEQIKIYLKNRRNIVEIILYRNLSRLISLIVFALSIIALSSNSYNPFLYFRF